MRAVWAVIFLLMGWSATASATYNILTSPLPVFSEKHGKAISGYSVDLTKGIVAEAGMQADVEQLPFTEIMQRIKTQPKQIVAGIVRTPARENDFYWITPIAASQQSIVLRKDSSLFGSEWGARLESLSSVAVVEGDHRIEIARAAGVKTIKTFANWNQALTATINGEVDATVYSPAGMALSCRTMNNACQALTNVSIAETAYSYVVLPKQLENSDAAVALTMAASEFKHSEAFSQLVGKVEAAFVGTDLRVSMLDGIISFLDDEPDTEADDLWIITDIVPNFSFLNEQGELEGYSVELVRHILRRAAIKQSIISAPWERIIREVQDKSNVLAFAVARTPERDELFHWITPITRNLHGLYGLSGQVKHTTLNEFPSGTRIAVIRDDYREKVAAEAGMRTYEFDSWTLATKALLDGEVDYVFASQGAINFACMTLDTDCEQVRLAFAYRYITTYLGLSKQGTSPALVERLRRAAVQVKHAPQFDFFATQWVSRFRQSGVGEVHIANGVVNLWSKTDE